MTEKDMKRQIKFRGLDFDGNWQYGCLIQVEAEWKLYSWIENCGTLIAVRSETIGQFTGLHDKNGKEIYEGDILYGFKKGSNSDRFYTGVIEWQTQQAGWIIRCGKYIMEILSLAMSGDGIETRLDSFETIGNIHEHPNLLTTTNPKEVTNE